MQAQLNVKLLSYTPDPEKIIATAAKLCYAGCSINELFEKQTSNMIEKFLNNLTEIGHESPTEHISFTFAIEGVSRSLTHQLVRHRIASYSQQSQRYVKLAQFSYIIPPSIANNKKAKKIFIKKMEDDQKAYDLIFDELMHDLILKHCINNGIQYPKYEIIELLNWFENEHNTIFKQFEKKVIEDARYVFPNACETKIIITMNARSLINFFHHRCCNRAQWEIRLMAEEMVKIVKLIAPTLFKYAGPKCIHGKCPEGKMSCCGQLEMKNKYLII